MSLEELFLNNLFEENYIQLLKYALNTNNC